MMVVVNIHRAAIEVGIRRLGLEAPWELRNHKSCMRAYMEFRRALLHYSKVL
jgi:hypothetical protein